MMYLEMMKIILDLKVSSNKQNEIITVNVCDYCKTRRFYTMAYQGKKIKYDKNK